VRRKALWFGGHDEIRFSNSAILGSHSKYNLFQSQIHHYEIWSVGNTRQMMVFDVHGNSELYPQDVILDDMEHP